MEDKIIEWAKEIQSIAQAGLFYGRDAFDRERYQRLREIAAEMMAIRTDIPLEKITSLFCRDVGHQTPYAYGVVKIFYQCVVTGGSFVQNIETSASRYFSLDELPPLAEEKCNEEQIRMCFESYGNDNWKVQFD